MFQKIRHIIFDFGGVLLNIDYMKTEKAFQELGVLNFHEKYTQLAQTDLFDALETGKIEPIDFVQQLLSYCRPGTTTQQVIDAWNAMLLDLPLRRLQILEKLRNQFDIYLLSNTNMIHEEKFHHQLKLDHGVPHIGVFFDRFYFSHRIGMRKPHQEAFQFVLDQNNLLPEHTLFIEDSPQHIEGAQKLGIQTIHLTQGMTIEKDIFRPKHA